MCVKNFANSDESVCARFFINAVMRDLPAGKVIA
jgi:hypothetical protein